MTFSWVTDGVLLIILLDDQGCMMSVWHHGLNVWWMRGYFGTGVLETPTVWLNLNLTSKWSNCARVLPVQQFTNRALFVILQILVTKDAKWGR